MGWNCISAYIWLTAINLTTGTWWDNVWNCWWFVCDWTRWWRRRCFYNWHVVGQCLELCVIGLVGDVWYRHLRRITAFLHLPSPIQSLFFYQFQCFLKRNDISWICFGIVAKKFNVTTNITIGCYCKNHNMLPQRYSNAKKRRWN